MKIFRAIQVPLTFVFLFREISYGFGIFPCPCIDYFNILDYNCLQIEIENGHQINDSCLYHIFPRIGSYELFHTIETKSYDCTNKFADLSSIERRNRYLYENFTVIENDDPDYPTYSDKPVRTHEMVNFDCISTNAMKLFELASYDNEYYNFMLTNATGTNQTFPVICSLTYRITNPSTGLQEYALTENIQFLSQETKFSLNHSVVRKNKLFLAVSDLKFYRGKKHFILHRILVGFRRVSEWKPYYLDKDLEVGVEVGCDVKALEHTPSFGPKLLKTYYPLIKHKPVEVKTISLQIRSARIFQASSIEFSVQWDSGSDSDSCDAETENCSIVEILCGFYMESKQADSGEKLFRELEKHPGQKNYLIYGATTSIKVPYRQDHGRFLIRTGFEETISNGQLRQIPSLQRNMVNLFKYNYWKKYRIETAQYPSIAPAKYKDIPKNSTLMGSILIPNNVESPRVLTFREIKNLKTTCGFRPKSLMEFPNKEYKGEPIQFTFARNLKPLKAIYLESHREKARSYIKVYFFELFTGKAEAEIRRNADLTLDGRDAIVQSTPIGVKYLQSDCNADPHCTFDLPETHIPMFYHRFAGCFHWLTQIWYFFLRDPETKTHTLSRINDEAVREKYLDQSGWIPMGSYRKEFPVQMICPSLHNVLVWTELDLNQKVHIYELILDASTGEQVGEPKEHNHNNLCSCSEETVVTRPVVDFVYPDLENPSLVELAVLCGSTICISPLAQSQRSSLVFNVPNSGNISWFTVDQTHIIYALDSDNKTAVIAGHGSISNGPNYTMDLLPFNSSELNALWSLHFPSDEANLPVPPQQCTFPNITNVKLEMTGETTGQLVIERKYNNSIECAPFNKPPIVYTILYAVLPNNLSLQTFPSNNSTTRDVSGLQCRNGRLGDDNHDMNSNCRTASTEPTRQSTLRHPMGNLMQNKDYFFYVTSEIDLYIRTKDRWFSGGKIPFAKKILNTKYVPSYIAQILGIGLPLIFCTVLILVVFVWYYKRRLYMYRHLTRLSVKDILREEKLGEGNFGEVWLAKMGKVTIVIKTLKESATDREEKEFRDEALLLSKFQNDNIVRPIGICLQSRPIMLGLEYINGGSLDGYLTKYETRKSIHAGDLIHIVKDALKGCLYLESKGYLHRDISARNCLIRTTNSNRNCKPQTVKLADFGLAKDIGHSSAYNSRDPGKDILPVAWTPPEAFSGKFSTKSDVWAFGVLMWEVFSFAAKPFGHCSLGGSHRCRLVCMTHSEVEFNICVQKKTLLNLPDPCSAAFCSALTKLFGLCWSFEPDDRPSFKQLQNYLSGATSEIMKIMFPDFDQVQDESTIQRDKFVPQPAYGASPMIAMNAVDQINNDPCQPSCAEPSPKKCFGRRIISGYDCINRSDENMRDSETKV